MLIDTHAHLNFEAFDDDRDHIIKDCLSKNIWVVNVGTNQETAQKAGRIAQQYNEGIYAAVGLHPYHVVNSDTKEEFDYQIYKELAENKKVRAIGEIGLDYTYTDEGEERKLQKEVLKKQLKLAQEMDLPVIIHCREAWRDLLQILGQWSNVSDQMSKLGVAHFYSGTWNQAKKLFKLGFLISFTGVVTFAREYDEVIKKAPLEELMVETDCPYVAPTPHRGKRNKPQYVKYVAQKIGEIKDINVERVEEKTTKNAREIFNI